MNKNSVKGSLLTGILVLFFSLTVAAQTEGDKLPVADQQQIIKSLLTEKFAKSSEKTIYISTANLSEEVLKDFPTLKNKKIQLVPPDEAKENCAYEFGEFEFIEKYVSVSFGNCREGLAYDFMKSRFEWKSVGLIIIKDVSY